MKKIFAASLVLLGLTGCATTDFQNTETVVTPPPRVIYVNPHSPWIHDPWMRHHWHWSWHHRHGWGWNHPRYHHFHSHPLPHRHYNDQRRTIPTPINPGNGSHIPRNENLK